MSSSIGRVIIAICKILHFLLPFIILHHYWVPLRLTPNSYRKRELIVHPQPHNNESAEAMVPIKDVLVYVPLTFVPIACIPSIFIISQHNGWRNKNNIWQADINEYITDFITTPLASPIEKHLRSHITHHTIQQNAL